MIGDVHSRAVKSEIGAVHPTLLNVAKCPYSF